MRAWWSTQRRKETPEKPDPAQFGIREDTLAARFGAYRARYAALL
jgi:hypothetical protein